MNCIQIIFHVYLFPGVNLMIFTTHLAPNVMIDLTVASGVLLNPNIVCENIALKSTQISHITITYCTAN